MVNDNPTDAEFFLSRCEREFDPHSGELLLLARNAIHALGLRRCSSDVARWALKRGYKKASVTWSACNAKTYFFDPWMAQEENQLTHSRSNEMSSPQLITSDIYTGIIKITPALRPTLDYFLENPLLKLALTRKRDNAQLIVTEAVAQSMKSSGEEAVQRRTEDFWLAEDLEELRQAYRDEGGQENGFIMRYTATLDKPKSDPTATWGEWVAKYVLREDGRGEVYRMGELLDLKEISRPLVVA